MQNPAQTAPVNNNPLHDIVMDLIRDGQRSMAWDLIDHYFSKSATIEEFDTLGLLALKADKRDTYLACAEAGYALTFTNEQRFCARMNLIKAYNAMNRPEDALFYTEMNLRIEPENFELLCQRAFNISLQGDKVTAEKILLDIQQQYPEQAYKLTAAFAGKKLREGQTAKGILAFLETFKPHNYFFETQLGMSRWTGVISPGRKLYVEIEGGIGDQMINIRFFDRLRALGMIPILVSQDHQYYHDINRLLRRHGHEVMTDRFMIDHRQQWVPMMSLPGYLNLSESQLWTGTYLRPLLQPHNKLSGDRPRIGIKCAGNPYFAQDEYRKIPLDVMLDNLPSDVDIYYIDKEPVETKDTRVISLHTQINSWEDTLDFVAQMDCIVSSCTSLVHAAGAIGKTTFVAVPIAEYYIWTTTHKDGSSPWYGDNFYVARQTKLRDWTEPLADICNRVCDLLGRSNG